MVETPKVTVRLRVDSRECLQSLRSFHRRLTRTGNRRRRSRWRWLCWFGFHWWEADILNDWRVIEEKCCRCGKERTLRLKVPIMK